MKLLNIEKQTNNPYLNMYKLTLRNKKDNIKEYFIASRREKEELACVTKDHTKADGVMIIPITKEGEVVLLKQYRPAIDGFLYELPAGMVDEGEDMIEGAKRELFEETGLKCTSYEILVKPSYTSVGMSDETTGVVKMIVEGELDTSNIEEDEEIEAIKIKIKDAKEFVKNNNVSIKGAIILSML
ncbi:NUDIX hydrolase [uncultured Clostridium sp.]|uniref:NUDIX hydrolase n=1 Tax=uncultured Clostridium sp. TaxID=59620 RepID=UPI00262DA29D|nr:NUDIX hydrolase [uncultured Clostridium sp.]